MSKKELNVFLGKETMTIAEAMAMIDKNAKGILFVVNKDGILKGCLTDGDIRRWLIKTGNLNANISEAMNKNPKKVLLTERKHALGYMKEKQIEAVPLVDTQNVVTDIVFDTDVEESTNKSEELSDVPVIIMAGGKGTRLYPYTKILPKPLIPIGDVPILERIINRFCDFGVNDYYMTVNYKKGMIKSYFADLEPEYSITYVEEDKPLGTAGSIKLIEKTFDTPVFVVNCDVLIQADYTDIYRYHKENGNVMTIVSALKNIEVPYGVLNSKERGIVTSMEEKPSLSYFVNTGMYIINPEVIDEIPKDTFFHMTHLADALMQKGKQVGIYPVSEDSFLDMGEFEEMRRMEEKLKF